MELSCFHPRHFDLSNTGVSNNINLSSVLHLSNCWKRTSVDVISSICVSASLTSLNICGKSFVYQFYLKTILNKSVWMHPRLSSPQCFHTWIVWRSCFEPSLAWFVWGYVNLDAEQNKSRLASNGTPERFDGSNSTDTPVMTDLDAMEHPTLQQVVSAVFRSDRCTAI